MSLSRISSILKQPQTSHFFFLTLYNYIWNIFYQTHYYTVLNNSFFFFPFEIGNYITLISSHNNIENGEQFEEMTIQLTTVGEINVPMARGPNFKFISGPSSQLISHAHVLMEEINTNQNGNQGGMYQN